MVKDIFIPKLGMTMEEATIAEWLAKDGDKVETGQLILVIDTEKVAHEVESPISGYLLILAAPGDVHPCGAVVGKLAETMEELAVLRKSDLTVEVKEIGESEPSTDPSTAKGSSSTAPEKINDKKDGRINIAPVAKRLAEQHQVDYSGLTGSGPGGRIVKKDIEELINAQSAAAQRSETAALPSEKNSKDVDVVAAPPKETADAILKNESIRVKKIIPLRGMRKTIAQRMHSSTTAAARVSVLTESDMSEMIPLRKYFNEKLSGTGVKITFTDMLILIVAKVLKSVPIINSSLVDDQIKVWEDINIGFAAAVSIGENEHGLMVPVIKNADQKGLVEISRARKELTDKARQGKLSPDEMSGSTFTITNTGPIYSEWHLQTPIINQPESAILGTSVIVERPVVKKGEIVIGSIMPMSLSFDHRVMDGVPISQFFAKLNEMIQDPRMLML